MKNTSCIHIGSYFAANKRSDRLCTIPIREHLDRWQNDALRNKDAILLGMNGPECGDIIFLKEEGFNIIHMDSLSTQCGYFDTSVSPIFVAAGTGIKEGHLTKRVIRQVDVAPTIAALMGVRMPAQNEGSVAHQILAQEF